MYLIIQEQKPHVLKDKYSVLKVYLYLQMLKKGHAPLDNDIDILCELFFAGGYCGIKEKKWFYKTVIDKKLRNSEQSISNKLTEFFEKKGYIFRTDRNCVELNYDFFPKEGIVGDVEGIGLSLKVAHAS